MSDERWFCYDGETLDWFDTQLLALRHAQKAMKDWEEMARDEGEWMPESHWVRVGYVTHGVKVTPVGDGETHELAYLSKCLTEEK